MPSKGCGENAENNIKLLTKPVKCSIIIIENYHTKGVGSVPRIFLGVGHGGTDSGAIGNGFKEKDLNLSIALACNEVLVNHGVTVMMSRTKDENDCITDEILECNNFKPDLAIDIHNNAGGGDGAECFYYHLGGTGKTLAENILTEIVKLGQNSRGAKTRLNSSGKDYYAFIREIVAPAVIVECAFIDNSTDIQILDTHQKQVAMGTALAKGILRTLGIPFVATNKIYRVQVGAYEIKNNAIILQNKLKSQGYNAFVVESTR